MTKILVTGSTGQIGSELVPALREKFGNDNVVALVHKKKPSDELKNGPFELADASDKESLKKIIENHHINQIYHLASILSVVGENKPDLAWKVNLNSLKNILDLAVEFKMEKVFWPSSIAAFGPTTPKNNTPQKTILEPTTMYGVTKVAGENLCNYYFLRYGLDIRSLRYPGIISYKTEPGGGTTDYAVAIFYEALKNKKYTCFVSQETVLPLMYMDDCVKATIDIMEADKEKIKERSSYNLTSLSFSVKELAEEIKKHIPEFKCTYEPDERQAIADSWPKVIDDSAARKDWGWSHDFNLKKLTEVMLKELKKKLMVVKKCLS